MPRLHGQDVATLVFRMALMPANVREADLVLGQQFVHLPPEFLVLDRLELAALAPPPAVELPLGHPFGKPFADVDAVADDFQAGRAFRASRPRITAVISMRLLVVSRSPPDDSISLPVAGWRRMKAQPPGPGLPLHAPSVNSCTSGVSSGGSGMHLSVSRRWSQFR